MSLGSDYLSGFSLGQSRREREKDRSMDYLRMLQQRSDKPMYMGPMVKIGRNEAGQMSVNGEPIRRTSAREIRMLAQEQALNQREAELNRQTASMTEQARAIELRERQKRLASEELAAKRTREAETHALGYQKIAKEESRESEDRSLNNAMRGFYSYNSGAVKDYFDRYGASDISIQGLRRGENGEVIVDFGEGQQEVYESPAEAIERLLIPAAAITAQMQARAKGAEYKRPAESSYERALRDRYTENVKAMNSIEYAGNSAFIEQKRVENQNIESILEDFAMKRQRALGGPEVPKTETDSSAKPRIFKNKKTGETLIKYPDGRQEVLKKLVRKPIEKESEKAEPSKNYLEFTSKTGEKRRITIKNGKPITYKKINKKWIKISG